MGPEGVPWRVLHEKEVAMRHLILSFLVLGLMIPGQVLAVGNILSPVPGSTLPSTTATFTWTVDYFDTASWLYAGTVPGSSDLYNSGNLGSRTSVTVNGLPANGRAFYVRLWTFHFSGWSYRDFTYLASSQTSQRKSEIASPTPGSTFSGTTATITWGGGSGVVDQRLVVGNARGAADVFDSAWLGRVSSTVARNLPTDGRVLYVRLFSQFTNDTQFSDYIYFAQSPSKSVITSPEPGSVLSGPSPTFSWTAGSGVTDRLFRIGSVRGGADLVSKSNLGSVTTLAVTGLPTDGRTLYVTLGSLIQNSWQYAEYTYTAPRTSGPVKSAMLTPAPNTTLTSARITFTWGGGSGVLEQWLYVGSQPATTTYYNSGSLGTRTSATVSGLPSDGRRLYVTLWSRLPSGWQYTVYTYTAASLRTVL
jgi:hypothetical protein